MIRRHYSINDLDEYYLGIRYRRVNRQIEQLREWMCVLFCFVLAVLIFVSVVIAFKA